MAWIKDISLNAGTDETVRLIIDTINDYYHSPTVKNILNQYHGNINDVDKFTKWLFDYVDKNVKYIQDPIGWERVFTPERLMRERQGDCKKMTTLIASVLKLAGYNPVLKVVNYGNGWEHIYPMLLTPKKIVLDPVNYHQYNKEVQHVKARIYNLNNKTYYTIMGNKLSQMGNMRLNTFREGIISGSSGIMDDIDRIGGPQRISGCTGCKDTGLTPAQWNNMFDYNTGVNGMGGLFSNIVNTVTNVVHTATSAVQNTVSNIINNSGSTTSSILLLPARVAFLGLVSAGALTAKTNLGFSLADSLAEAYLKNPNGLKSTWGNLGGDWNSLAAAIRVGSGNQSIKGMGYATLDNSNPVMVGRLAGDVSAQDVTQAVSAAGPIIAAILKFLTDNGIIKGDKTQGATDLVNTIASTYTPDGQPIIPFVAQPIATQAATNPIVAQGTTLVPPKQLTVSNQVAELLPRVVATSNTNSSNTSNDSAAKQGSLIDFTNLLSTNTYVKSIFLGGMFQAATNEIIIPSIFAMIGIAGLTIISSKKITKLFKSI